MMCHRQGAAPAPCNLNSRFSLCRGGQGNGREFNVNYTFIPLPDHKFLSRLRGMQLSPPITLSWCRFHFSWVPSCLLLLPASLYFSLVVNDGTNVKSSVHDGLYWQMFICYLHQNLVQSCFISWSYYILLVWFIIDTIFTHLKCW